jgi:hypothetical protein
MKQSTPSLSSFGSMLWLALAAAAFAGCATGGSSAPANPNEPVKLAGSRYKLLAAGGGLDGRVVEFIERGEGLRGCLVAPGVKLRGVSGIDMGTWVYSLQKKGLNEYEGVYRAIGPDGSIQDKQVSVNFAGDNLGWNLESATWERQSDSNMLSDEEKKRCMSK